MKHFAEQLLENTYDSKIAESRIRLETQSEKIISIKLRPVRTNEKDEYENAYSSSYDYKEFREHLNNNKEDFQSLDSNYSSIILTTKYGEKIIYIEHESGPELIFDYSLKAIQFIATIGELILLIVEIMKRNDDKMHKKVVGKNRIEAITIEERKKGKKVKVTKIIRIEGEEKIDLNKKEILKLLKKLK
ncbi:hypothetical protein QWY31_09080 [Cytophagales bacterium LB-30]|uniref:Uncharacterized protein n=1 Tax=Shiella aurantiaca TaxID=3058365 RepID=A0ABT8F5Y0_9BACT|nr:hypothetical protein [Shiella aurantiaca]MDN4165654.1 hypothetical protein [Shiella aurantiaca]